MTKAFDILLVANGHIPSQNDWHDLQYTFLICTDGAADTLLQYKLIPNVIIGDFDSLANAKERFPQSQLVKIDDQNTTDFEKALQYCIKFPNKKIVCLGALGGFADHGIHNLSLMVQYHPKLDLCFLNPTPYGSEWIFVLKAKTRIYTPKNSLISFFPFPEATLTAPTLEWPLDRTHITQIGKHAVRNRTTQELTEVECEGKCVCFVNSPAYPALVSD
ncbi:MAG: thiamine diphosphokinase [Candidatus Berkiella sp.]